MAFSSSKPDVNVDVKSSRAPNPNERISSSHKMGAALSAHTPATKPKLLSGKSLDALNQKGFSSFEGYDDETNVAMCSKGHDYHPSNADRADSGLMEEYDVLAELPAEARIRAMRQLADKATAVLMEEVRQSDYAANTGTTLCSLMVVGDMAFTWNVGDSIAVVSETTAEGQNKYRRFTNAVHNVQHLLESSSLTAEEEKEKHRLQALAKRGGVQKNRIKGNLAISRSIGMTRYDNDGLLHTPDFAFCHLDPKATTRLAVFSDGITDYLKDDKEMEQYFREHAAENVMDFVRALTEKASRVERARWVGADDATAVAHVMTAQVKRPLAFFLAVYDGHGGREIAVLVRQLYKTILKTVARELVPDILRREHRSDLVAAYQLAYPVMAENKVFRDIHERFSEIIQEIPDYKFKMLGLRHHHAVKLFGVELKNAEATAFAQEIYDVCSAIIAKKYHCEIDRFFLGKDQVTEAFMMQRQLLQSFPELKQVPAPQTDDEKEAEIFNRFLSALDSEDGASGLLAALQGDDASVLEEELFAVRSRLYESYISRGREFANELYRLINIMNAVIPHLNLENGRVAVILESFLNVPMDLWCEGINNMPEAPAEDLERVRQRQVVIDAVHNADPYFIKKLFKQILEREDGLSPVIRKLIAGQLNSSLSVDEYKESLLMCIAAFDDIATAWSPTVFQKPPAAWLKHAVINMRLFADQDIFSARELVAHARDVRDGLIQQATGLAAPRQH